MNFDTEKVCNLKKVAVVYSCFDIMENMRTKIISSYPDDIEKYYYKLSLFINTETIFVQSKCASDNFTLDLPKLYKMLLVEYLNCLNQQYVNGLIYDMYGISKLYLINVSKKNAECSFKDWIYYNVQTLMFEKKLSVLCLSYPFISHGIFLHNISDYNNILSPTSKAYTNFLVKSRRENHELRDLDYLSDISLRFVRDIHRFDVLLKRIVEQTAQS
jgi:hypothetical protein